VFAVYMPPQEPESGMQRRSISLKSFVEPPRELADRLERRDDGQVLVLVAPGLTVPP